MESSRRRRGRFGWAIVLAVAILALPPAVRAAYERQQPSADCGFFCRLERLLEELWGTVTGEGGEAPGPETGIEASGTRVERRGIVHRATAAHPVERVEWTPPPGDWSRLRLGVTVTRGPWAQANPRGTHNLFWLALNRNRDLYGYLNLRNRSTLFARHGIGRPQGEKARMTGRLATAEGASYRFEWIYDTRARRIDLTVSQGSRRLTALRGRPDVDAIRVRPGDRFLVDLGFTGRDNPNEPASLGWIWSDLELEIE